MDDRLYFRQLLAGRDFARADPIARQMVNFVYLVGDRETGRGGRRSTPPTTSRACSTCSPPTACASPAPSPRHYHPDHVGGSMMGHSIAGIEELLALAPVPIHVQADEVPWVTRVTEVAGRRPGRPRQRRHRDGRRDPDRADPHARPHARAASASSSTAASSAATPSSSRAAVAPTSPAAIPAALYDSLTNKLAKVPDDAVLFPGHLYSAEPSATMADTRRWNYVFTPSSEAEWLAMFGR